MDCQEVFMGVDVDTMAKLYAERLIVATAVWSWLSKLRKKEGVKNG